MQRYFSSIKNHNYFLLNDNDIYHITRVMRMKNDDKIEVVYNNELYIAIIEDLNNSKFKIVEKENTILDKKPYVVLCIPLLKEQKMDYIFQKATELGVNEIIPVILERSIVNIDSKEDKKIERWTRICKEASEQSKRLDIPVVTGVRKLSDLKFDGIKCVCSTVEHGNTIKNVLTKEVNSIMFVMGPEGGLSPREEKELNDMGFASISLGNRIMRVETVPLYIMSVINYEYME